MEASNKLASMISYSKKGKTMFLRIYTFAIVLLISFVILLQGDIMAGSIKPSHYEHGHTIYVKSLKVSVSGGLIEINNTGTPVDGTVIEIPKGALEKEVNFSVGYDDGILNLRSGKESGTVIVLSTTPEISFQKPVTIKIRFNPSISPRTIVGYDIDKRGSLHSLDIGSINIDRGVVSFYTYKPLMFTWVYIY